MKDSEFEQLINSARNQEVISPSEDLLHRILQKRELQNVKQASFFKPWNIAAASIVFVALNSFVALSIINKKEESHSSNYEVLTDYILYENE